MITSRFVMCPDLGVSWLCAMEWPGNVKNKF